MNKKYPLGLIFLFFLLTFTFPQSRIIQEAPWAQEDFPEAEVQEQGKIDLELYLPLEFLGGNIMNFGVGCSLYDRALDIQFQGAFAYYEWDEYSSVTDDYSTWGFTLGGDVSHHLYLWNPDFGLYYGLLYRYNHIAESDFNDYRDTHWTGLSLGAELHRNRLTFYGESLWFLQNLYWDVPSLSFSGGVKLWL
ncbi:MAG: hypothetical protein PQJ60_07435 [Spirochaetales bacterium]|nr:hypothetical protein [Spirochaetales bacterium]